MICGFCGSKDYLTYEIERDGSDIDGEHFEDCVYIRCGNCSALTEIDEVLKRHERKDNADKQG